MKKLIYLIIVMVVVGLVVSGCVVPVVPTLGEKNNGNGNGNGNGIDLTGYHYNLNLIGKKADWSGSGNYEGNRHTMFVPQFTDDGPFSSFNVGSYSFDGIKISMTQGTEFAVLDGNAFDDGVCSFQLAPGKYQVYIVAKAKPHPNKDDPVGYYTNITGWVYCLAFEEFLFSIGEIKVGRKLSKKFEEITHMFYVDAGEDDIINWLALGLPLPNYPVWVFEYLELLKTLDQYDNAEYFWQYDNHGNKLVKVRFYPVD